ncbi:unnamed protein product, partial [Prorocentrum cordatum]
RQATAAKFAHAPQPQPPLAAQLPAPPHGHAEGPGGRLQRVLPPGQVSARQARIFSERGGFSGSPWRAEEWLLMRRRALQSGRTDELVPLLEAVRASTEKAIRDGSYEAGETAGRLSQSARVDLSAISSANPHVAWRRRETLSARPPPPQLGRQAPRLQIGSESVLDTAIRLRRAGVESPIVVVAEVQAFAGDGSIDTRTAQAVSPGDLLLRSDFGRFVGALRRQCSSHRDGRLPNRLPSRADAPLGALCNVWALASTLGAPARGEEANLRGELAAPRGPSIVACQQVTVFRGPAEDGYPFLREPVHVTVLVTAFPCGPQAHTLSSAGSHSEWYAVCDERDAVVERLELLAELARREPPAGGHAGEGPPLLLLCPPGCGAPRRQPRHALAYALKAWRLRYGGCFGAVHLCCRDSRGPLEELAGLLRSVINEEPAHSPVVDAARGVEPDDLEAAFADVRRDLPSEDVAASIDAIIALQRTRKEARHQARAELDASERHLSDPGATTRIVERRLSQQAAAAGERGEGSRRFFPWGAILMSAILFAAVVPAVGYTCPILGFAANIVIVLFLGAGSPPAFPTLSNRLGMNAIGLVVTGVIGGSLIVPLPSSVMANDVAIAKVTRMGVVMMRMAMPVLPAVMNLVRRIARRPRHLYPYPYKFLFLKAFMPGCGDIWLCVLSASSSFASAGCIGILTLVRTRFCVIIAGCAFADLLMRATLLRDMDHQVDKFRYAYYGMVADDIQCLLVGTPKFLMEQAPFVASSLLHVLSVSARLPVSVPKLALLTSDPALAEGVIQAVPVLRRAWPPTVLTPVLINVCLVLKLWLC